MAKKTRNARIIMKGSDVSGVIPTIPLTNDHTDGTWLDTDIYEKEYFFNTVDKKVFSRMGGVIIDVTFTITPNFTVSNFLPNIIDEQSTGNVITVTGTNFKNNMTVRIPDTGLLVFSNVSLTYINETTIQVNFDMGGDISTDSQFDIFLDKEGYETSFSMNADVNLEITLDDLSGIISKSSSEILPLYFNENITLISLVETDNVNVTVNSYEPSYDMPSGNPVNVDLNTSAASYDETFKIRVVGDGETTPWYDMAIEPTLAIIDNYPFAPSYNTSSNWIELETNKAVISLTNIESNNPNVVVNSYTIDGDPTFIHSVFVDLDTTAAGAGETFSLRITADGQTTDYYLMNVAWIYEEFDEVSIEASLSYRTTNYNSITGWNKITNPTLWFLSKNANELYAYESKIDRDTDNNAVFYVILNNSTIIEQNSSGYGGTLSYTDAGGDSTGDKMWVHAPEFTYTETDEIGTPSSNLTEYESITGWDKINKPTLYLYRADDISIFNDGYEIYDNATSRDNRTAGDLLAYILNSGGDNMSLLEANSSGFGGSMTGTNSNVGDKMYVTAS